MKRYLVVGALIYSVGCSDSTGDGTGGGGRGGGAGGRGGIATAGTTGGSGTVGTSGTTGSGGTTAGTSGGGTTGTAGGSGGGTAGASGAGAGGTTGAAGAGGAAAGAGGRGGAGGNAGAAAGAAGQAGSTAGAGGRGGAAGGTAGAAGGGAGGRGGAGGSAGAAGGSGTPGTAGAGGGAGAGGRGGTTGTAGAGTGGGAAGGSGTTGAAGAGDANQAVLQRNRNASRDGHFVQSGLTKAAAATLVADTAFNTAATFSGPMWGSPLYFQNANGTGVFVAATATNNVYAINEDGSQAWMRNIGAPATDVGCFGDNGGIPTLGIISTPVIDAASRTLFVAGATLGTQGAIGAQVLTAINIDDGTIRSGWPVNVSSAIGFDPVIHNQRSALSLVNGIIYVAYGGFVGDCGTYRGRVVAVNASNPSSIGGWATGGVGEGIWAAGGMASDGNGVIAITGNRTQGSGAHADSEEVVRITGMGTRADVFYPTNWMTMDDDDADFGASHPVFIQLSGATPSNMVAAISKDGHLYLLDAAQLRGTSTGAGGQKVDFVIANGSMAVHTAPGSYRTAQGLYVVLSTTGGATGCPGGGSGRQVMSVRIAPGNPPVPTLAWCAPMSSPTTGPIATTTDGTSNAVVWYMSGGQLRGVDGDTGAAIYSGTSTCAGVQRWTSPIAVKNRIIAGGNGRLCAWRLP